MANGRPRKEVNGSQVEALRERGLSWQRVADTLGVHRNTLLATRRDAALVAGVADSKRCGGQCQQVLSIEKFSVDRSRRDGRNLKCRRCTSEQWKKNNSSPCVDCGNPRRALTPGQCRRCYQFAASLKRTEFEALWLIPNYIAAAHEGTRNLIRTLSRSRNASKQRRLQILVEGVCGGTQRTITTEN